MNKLNSMKKGDSMVGNVDLVPAEHFYIARTKAGTTNSNRDVFTLEYIEGIQRSW